MRKRWIGLAVGGVGVAAFGAVLAKEHQVRHARHLARQAGDRLVSHARHGIGRWQGARYHLARRRPDPNVSDLILADRIRSSLGRLEKRLDLPHVHVMVEDHTVLLHGEVDTPENIRVMEEAVANVSGVVGIESHLHTGLTRGDTRPSQGKAERHLSQARQRLELAARQAGVSDRQAVGAVRAVLGALSERIPEDELRHLRSHLPADVQVLMEPPRRTGAGFRRVRTVPEFVAEVLSVDGIPPDSARAVVGAILTTLKELVPEEATDVAAVLPEELRHLWGAAGP